VVPSLNLKQMLFPVAVPLMSILSLVLPDFGVLRTATEKPSALAADVPVTWRLPFPTFAPPMAWATEMPPEAVTAETPLSKPESSKRYLSSTGALDSLLLTLLTLEFPLPVETLDRLLLEAVPPSSSSEQATIPIWH